MCALINYYFNQNHKMCLDIYVMYVTYDVMNFFVIFLLFAIVVGSSRLCWNRRR